MQFSSDIQQARTTDRARLALLICSMVCAWSLRADERVIVFGERPVEERSLASTVTLDDLPLAEQSFGAVADRIANLDLSGGGAGSFGDLLGYRGLANTPYFSDASVSIYLDDIPLPGVAALPPALLGFSTATLARGPQGSSYGRAGSMGVLSLASRAPGSSAGVELRQSAGNYDANSTLLHAQTARAGDECELDASLTAFQSRRDGFIRNVTLDETVDDQRSAGVSARLRWLPHPAAGFTLQLLDNRIDNGAQPLVPLEGARYSVVRDREGATDIDLFGIAVKGEFALAPGRLSSTTSHTDWRLDPYENQLVLPPALDSRVVQRQRALNQEFRFSDASQGPVHWSIGAWLSDTDTEGAVERGISGLFTIEKSRFELESAAGAVFGELQVQLAQEWQMIAGLRLERTDRTFRRTELLAPQPTTFIADDTFDAVLPKLALTHALTPNTTLSVTAALGARPGGWSAYTADPQLAQFDMERTALIEMGIDTVLAERLQLAARVFTGRIRNYQIERSFNAADYLVVNAARARTSGLELEASWRVTEGFNLAATIGINDTTLREFTDPFTSMSYDGKRAPYAPAYDANLSATWRRGRWYASGEISAVGRTHYDETEAAQFMQRSHVTFDLTAGYESERWRLGMFGANLTNEYYRTLIVPGVLHAVPSSPRTWGIEVTVRTGRSGP